jgi:hypothetical protein
MSALRIIGAAMVKFERPNNAQENAQSPKTKK